jgi:hypothetical protein
METLSLIAACADSMAICLIAQVLINNWSNIKKELGYEEKKATGFSHD